MTKPSHITAAFEVFASTAADVELDVTGMTPDQVADRLQDVGAYVGVCHECAHVISDPELGDLTGFSIGGRHYGLDPETGSWVESS
jgi:hypothetical protein